MVEPTKRSDVPAVLVDLAAEVVRQHSLAEGDAGLENGCACGVMAIRDWDKHWAEAALATVLPVALEKGLVTLWGSPEEVERRRRPANPDNPAEIQRRLRESLGLLGEAIEVLLLNREDELAKPPGEADPEIRYLADVYQQATGWTPAHETEGANDG